MRMELELELEQNVFPVDFRRVIVSFLKNALAKCNKGQFYDLYFQGAKTKDYCFSVILPQPSYQKDIILLKGTRIRILFSADDAKKTGLIFYYAFAKQKNRRFPLPDGNAMVLLDVTQKEERLITSSQVIFKTTLGSGLVVRDHDRESNKDRYYVFYDVEFPEKLNRVLREQAAAAGFSVEPSQICFTPMQCRKVLAKHYDVYVDLTVGMFRLQAPSGLLQYFYAAGLGSRHSSGFGMVDLIKQD